MTTPTREINLYLSDIDSKYRQGNAKEHSYRPSLQNLFEAIMAEGPAKGLSITNEPAHMDCGAPDYIIARNGVPVGYIEAKDIPVGIHHKANKAQFDRYKKALNNLIITDYINFELFVDGELRMSAAIGTVSEKGVAAKKEQFADFAALMDCFISYNGKTITSSEELAFMMAQKARLLSETIKDALNVQNAEDDSLGVQLKGFQKILIHDLSNETFADMYAQTLAYGMFAARLNDRTNAKFSRKSAADLIPQSNPFLRKFFQYIAGFDLDNRICWIVDALADIFNFLSLEDLFKEFGKANQDPFVHFYETFLSEYDPKLRESRGVYYTPFPAVQFIVQALDAVLVKDFSLPQGLADTKVHILEPALGTGTFLSTVIDKIYERFVHQKGLWQSYCSEHLLPRLNGFEILMAPYTMAHFRLDMKLKETGYESKERLRVFLTNSLEQSETIIQDLPFASWLSDEAIAAGKVKRDAPVMVVMGNPPYSVSTQNKGEWIQNLIADYKAGLEEKNIQPLSDDYIKFIRYGQYYVDKNKTGILAYVSNNSFIDGQIHRKMRECLLESFDAIYILNLHGNAKKNETAPDGSKDENIFNIMQGVSINIFIKTGKKKESELAEVKHFDLYGTRELKYQFLLENTLATIKWQKLIPETPHFFFLPKDFSNQAEYEKGFRVAELFQKNNNGIKTHKDAELISFSAFETGHNQEIQYRPFDYRFIDYDLKKVVRHRYSIMQHFLQGGNIGLIVKRGGIEERAAPVFLSKTIIDTRTWSRAGMQGAESISPLYLYPDADSLDPAEKRRPNLNMKIVDEIAAKTSLQFIAEKESDESSVIFAPIDILDYIYAVLHSPTYREKYREFLKIDFPRVPYPESAGQFFKLAVLGETLRKIHLLEGVEPSHEMGLFPVGGSCEVEKLEYKGWQVWINKTQYFDAVPPEVWNFYIGGYQPAQKWLKDRKERVLDFDQIQHYQRILAALQLTGKLMAQVDAAYP